MISTPEGNTSHRSSSSRLRVILYHHLTEKPCEFVDQLGISTPPDLFEAHLHWLAKRYDFVTLDAVLRGDLPRRPLLITFDDGYRSILDIAAPILRRFAAPSVFFLSRRIVAGEELPFDNLLSYLMHRVDLAHVETAITGRAPMCASLSEIFAEVVASLSWGERIDLASRLARHFDLNLPDLRRQCNLFLRPEELAGLAEFGIEVGNHTRSHIHCRSLDSDGALEEIVQHRGWLEEAARCRVRSFSFPYGSRKDATGEADRALRESGHEAIFLVEARMNPRRHPGPYWYRVSMQDQPASMLRRRLEILPRVRSARDMLQGRHLPNFQAT